MLRLEDDSVLIHYELRDNSTHVIDARVEAETSLEYIKAINYVSKICGIRNNLQTGSLESGSVVKIFWYGVDMGHNTNVLRYVLAIIFRIVFFEKKTITMNDIYTQIANLKKEDLAKVLDEYHINEKTLVRINNHISLKKARSECFKHLQSCKSIKGIGIKHHDFDELNEVDFHIEASNFKNYIEEILPETKFVDNAQVFIISPVIVKGRKIKWLGIYSGKDIKFEIMSNQFKAEAQNAAIDFRTGFYIKCKLQYDVSYDEDEKPVFSNYKVLEVYGHGCDDNYIETLAGKKKRIMDNQPSLFDGMDGF